MAETKQTQNKKIPKHRETPIPETKIKRVKELADLVNKKKTVLIASIKNLPAAQLQEIGKGLRGKAILKVPKKNLFFRALESAEKEDVKKLKDKFKADVAVLFSDEDSFDLSADLLQNKSPAKAKPGQIAPMDIEVQEGPTDLIPGPAISELGALGIQIQIEKGKITIKAPKVIVKEGEEISQAAADVMAKLDIKPFSIGLIPVAAFDNSTNTLYLEIAIDSEEAINELKDAFGRALPFAVEIGYSNSETISFMIGKAAAYEKALSGLMKEEPKEEKKEKVKEEKAEEPEKKEESKEKPAEEKPAEVESKEEKKEKVKEEKTEEPEKKEEKVAEDQTQTPETKQEESKPQEIQK